VCYCGNVNLLRRTAAAEELVEEVAGFPFMSHDDLVDSTTQALLRFRNGGFLRLPTDEPDEEIYYRRKQNVYY
jgi:phage terminase large subunit-like protein